jgi:hypothetical protein
MLGLKTENCLDVSYSGAFMLGEGGAEEKLWKVSTL